MKKLMFSLNEQKFLRDNYTVIEELIKPFKTGFMTIDDIITAQLIEKNMPEVYSFVRKHKVDDIIAWQSSNNPF